MIKSFFKTFEHVLNFGFLKACYDSMLHVYNGLAKPFRSSSDSNSAYKKAEKHVCHKGCDLAGCAYDKKPKTTPDRSTSWFGLVLVFLKLTRHRRETLPEHKNLQMNLIFIGGQEHDKKFYG